MNLAISTRRGGLSKTVTKTDAAAWRVTRGRVTDLVSTTLAQAAAYDTTVVDTPPAAAPLYPISAEPSARD
jgi:hypothetical protein